MRASGGGGRAKAGRHRPERVAGLDGIRGLAALYVVAYHTFTRAFPGTAAHAAPFWAAWLAYGRFAVVVFIVLSGFALAVPPAQSGWRLGGLTGYARRRAWRILPPYWTALLFSLLVAWLLVPQPGQAVPTLRSVIVNGLLLQDVVAAPSPNRAFWTIPIEAALYLLFPVLLLAARRLGPPVMLGVVALAVILTGLLAPWRYLILLAPDFALLFAIGVVAAGVLAAGRRASWPWHRLAFAAAVPALALVAWQGLSWTQHNLFWVDLALGPAIGALLAAVATRSAPALVRLLDARPLRRLGSFSYSLYLTHAPIVMVATGPVLSGRIPAGVPMLLVGLALVLPVTIAFAWAFAARFELPFQRYRSWRALAFMVPGRWRRPAGDAVAPR